MNLRKWIRTYFLIAKLMRYNVLLDQLSPIIALLLNVKKLLFNNQIGRMIEGRNVFIFGGGPSLTREINEFKSRILKNYRDNITIICADSAITPLVEHSVIPDIIVTDLDGDIKYLIYSSRKGSILIIHCHSDNMYQILKFTKYLGRIIISTQVIPIYPIINYGGYTDGDRSIILAGRLGAKKIFLVGMDFEDKPDPYNKYRRLPTRLKKVKLRIAEAIINNYLAEDEEIYVISGGATGLKRFPHINWGDVEKIIMQSS